MNCSSFKAKLLKAKNYTEAQPLLETVGLSPSAHQIMIWAYQFPPEQEQYRQQAFSSVIQEATRIMEEEEEKKGKMHEEEEEEERGRRTREEEDEEDEEKKKRMSEEEEDEEDEEKKTREYEGGQGHISGMPGMAHLPMEGKQTGSGAKPDTGFEGAQDQMRETLIKAGIPPAMARKLVKELSTMKPMSYGQQLDTINSAVRRYIIPLQEAYNKQQQAIVALGKQVREMSTSTSRAGSFEIPMRTTAPRGMRETSSLDVNSVMQVSRKDSLVDVRNDMEELNNAYHSGALTAQN